MSDELEHKDGDSPGIAAKKARLRAARAVADSVSKKKPVAAPADATAATGRKAGEVMNGLIDTARRRRELQMQNDTTDVEQRKYKHTRRA